MKYEINQIKLTEVEVDLINSLKDGESFDKPSH